jgi:hypothetical protein
MLALASTLACSGPIEEDSDGALGVDSQALKWPGDPNGPLEFDPWVLMPSAGFSMTGDPVLTNCDAHCLVAFQRGAAASGNQYWGLAAEGPSAGLWTQYDTRSFASNPAAVHFKTIGTERHILVVGRGSGSTSESRRMFWSTAKVTPVGGGTPDFNSPEKLSEFQQINTNSFNDPYGYPALATSSGGTVVMAYIGPNASNQARVYAQRKPYSSEVDDPNWKARVEAPALPSSFTPVGTPAITWGYSSPDVYTIVVRAQRTGFSDRLYRIFFSGTAYTDPFGAASWKSLTLPSGSPAVQSNPAVEWGDQLFTHTVYYRSGSSLYQASFIYDTLEEVPKIIMHNSFTPFFSSAPSVNGNLMFEIGQHWVIGRDSQSNLWFTTSQDDELGMVP